MDKSRVKVDQYYPLNPSGANAVQLTREFSVTCPRPAMPTRATTGRGVWTVGEMSLASALLASLGTVVNSSWRSAKTAPVRMTLPVLKTLYQKWNSAVLAPSDSKVMFMTFYFTAIIFGFGLIFIQSMVTGQGINFVQILALSSNYPHIHAWMHKIVGKLSHLKGSMFIYILHRCVLRGN